MVQSATSDASTADTIPHSVMLSRDDECELRHLSEALEAEFLSEYEAFTYTNGRRVDTNRWKPVRQKDDLVVRRERGSGMDPDEDTVTGPPVLYDDVSRMTTSESLSEAPFYWRSRSATMVIGAAGAGPTLAATPSRSPPPMLLATGTVPGTLDDALFGLAIHDEASLRVRSLYNKERAVQDCSVLATLETATHDDPYRFMGIVWLLSEHGPTHASDQVVFIHTHTRKTSRGDRIGLALVRPVSHRSIPDCSSPFVRRDRRSMCVIFRQLDEQRVETFATHAIEPLGGVSEKLVVQDAAQQLLALVIVTEIGLAKKLQLLMRTREMRSVSDSREHGAKEPDGLCCCACRKNLSGLFTGHGKPCQLCQKLACSKCRVSKLIVVKWRPVNLALKPFEFCLCCMMTAVSTSTLKVAQMEVNDRAGHSDVPSSVPNVQ